MWSYEQFVAEGAELVARSQKPRRQPQRREDGDEVQETAEWQWRHGKRPHLPGNSYLVSLGNARRQKALRVDERPTKQSSERDALDDINALLEEDDNDLSDPVSLLHEIQAHEEEEEEIVLFDFHIVFHAVYQAPVLYFRITRLDGSPIPFHSSSIAHGLHLPGSDSRTPLVAMEDHQVLGTPFYFLHPCETANAMELLLDQPARSNLHEKTNTSALEAASSSERHKEPTYLLAWLSLVQPLTSINPQMY